MEFRILGALEVTHDGRAVPVGGGRQRALLALLLLERNTPVSAERIVEELWNGRAPPTAPKVVQNLVSQLRRSLGDAGLLRTRGHAYELAVPDTALDAARFERLVEDGRVALAAGEPERAAAVLREALALWRGPALGDLAGEPWARAEAGRLEERRLVALERRVDADLALGRHADVIAELETAIAREPLREGMRSRLMLALYRSGRQAEALEQFQDARRTLVGELGIEPGPELRRLHGAILEQDPALELPRAPRGEVHRPASRRRRGGVLLVAGGAALILAAVAGAALLAGDETVAPAAEGGEAVAIDVATGRVGRRIPAARAPSAVAAGGGRLWMVDGEARTLIGVDRDSGTVDSIATGATPMDVAMGGDGAVWVVNGTPRARTAELGPITSEVVRLDASTGRQDAAVRLPDGGSDVSRTEHGVIAVSPDAVWAITADGAVVRIDQRTASISGAAPSLRASAIAAGEAGVWAVGPNGRLVELDPRTAAVRRRVRLPTDDIGALAVGEAVWASSWGEGKLWRVGAGEDVPVSVPVGSGVTDLAVTPTSVWATDPVAGTVTQVDPEAPRVVRTVSVGGVPRSLAADGDTVWVAVTGAGGAATSEVAGVAPLPGSICEPVVAGPGGRADVLVVSDMPLQGDTRLTATQMAQAIAFTLREHGFRAGRLRIAYQSCDDALPATGVYDEAKCAANGRAYRRDADVVGVIGAFNSGCSYTLIPALNRAAGGPVPMIAPLNSHIGLTRAPPGGDAQADLSALYPTGKRNYVRIFPADDVQTAALAQFARDRGRRRVYLLDDGEPSYSLILGDAFERAAEQLGLDVVRRERWRSKARSYAGLAERVADSGAHAVVLTGLPQNNGGAVIRALRKRLGDGVDVMTTDSFGPPSRILEAAGARAARGVFISVGTQVLEELPPKGKAFVARFSRTQPGVKVEAFAAYAAQATEVLLDAIARSDGTRASVLERLFDARLDDSLIGDIAFDDRGDIARGGITVLRVVGGPASANISSAEGAVVERVIHPSTALVDR
jgi:DNA-binding SARP family transcriptional activator/ABC-type branched-subunit amino acid transport system substrate-binding protein